MSIQLIEVYVPNQAFATFERNLEQFETISHWNSSEANDYMLVRILVKMSQSEDILNYLEQAAKENDDFSALLFSLKTYIPHVEDKKEELEETKENEEDEKELLRVSRHELYSVVFDSSAISKSFSWFLLLSAVVATAGIVKDSPAIVIGAMMIAPIIGPFTAVAFASVLGDYKLLRRSLISAGYGLVLPIGIAVLFGMFFPLPMDSQEFLSRNNIELIDIFAALAAGAAGAISFLKRAAEALVGVMVSVALLPPAVVFGMMLGDFNWQGAITPCLLLLVNTSSIVLSAIVVYWVSGIKPVNWQEIQEAYTSRKYSLLFVSIIVLVLAVVIFFIQFYQS
ncbi:TIGR00341 family protein [Alteribacillus persepolensis]|uniref:TIGR00341 family protein n=1 Tax=Alteribacillus persepolensis TaxID=568899 RepID=A0A1G8JWV3_9BACI|nr:TIGR00341 family protein [Alteribacillus persepolensis]SDI35605.1 TIGR00341 family protein [Alteribacillus persepolensis]